MNYNGNEQKNPMEDMAKDLGNKAAEVGKKGAKQLAKKVGQAVKKIAVKVAKKAAMMAIKAIGSALAAISPYILIALAVILVIVLGWYLLFETRGSESRYSFDPDAENAVTYNADSGYFKTSETSSKNKAIVDFYRTLGKKAYWQITGSDNKDLKKPDGTVVDYYKQESLFSINPNFLFVMDEFIHKNEFRYPEQFMQHVNYDPTTMKLKPLVDDVNKVVNVESNKYAQTGFITGEKEKSVHDYGLASIFKYKQADRTQTVEGFYTQEEVWNQSCKCVETTPIHEPFKEVMHGFPKKIWLIDKVVTFALDVTLAYETAHNPLDGLRDGESDDPKEDVVKIKYGTWEDWEDESYTETDPDTGEEVQKTRRVLVASGPLYKYRQGQVFETLPKPAPQNNVEQKYGTDYIKYYLANYNAWVPETVMEKFDFHGRVGQIVDSDLNIGGSTDSSNWESAFQYIDLIKKYCEMYGVDDPMMIVALISQESGGNPKIKDGLMQIDSANGDTRSVSAKNVKTGQSETFTVSGQADRQNPDKAIHWGVMYFANKLNNFGGDYLKALQSYNVDVSSYIKDHYADAWASTDWLNYREEARVYLGKAAGYGNTKSASYDCAPNLEPVGATTVFGDVCYLEHVLRYYDGDMLDGLAQHDKEEPGFWSKVGKFLGITGSNYDDNVKKKHFVHNMGETEYNEALKSVTTFDQNVLFSEVGMTESMNFWDSGFTTTNANLTADQFVKLVPNANGYISPLNIQNPIITSPFGSRTDPVSGEAGAFHAGVDVGVPIGTPLYAIADGTVENVGKASGYGQWIVIRLDDGNKTIYGHISSWSVKVGDKVKQGQLVGLSGNEGKSTGPHLHFEFHLADDKAIDGYSILVH